MIGKARREIEEFSRNGKGNNRGKKANAVIGVIVIVSSVLFFSVFNISGDSKGGPPFHFKNMFGVLLVIGGVASYSYVTMHLQRQQQRQQLQKYHQAQVSLPSS